MTVHHCWVGAPTAGSARLSTRTSGVGSLRWVVSTSADLSSPLFASAVAPDAAGLAKHVITGLTAGTPYFYGLEADGVLLTETTSRGRFRTLPVDGSQSSFSFWFASCRRTDSNHVVYDAIRARDPLMGLMLGDIGYDDPGSEAVTRYMWQTGLAQPRWGQLVREVATTYTYDNHDFCAPLPGAWGESPNAAIAQSYARAYATHYPLPDNGLYVTWRIGRCRFIQLDTRTMRTDPAAPDGTAKTVFGDAQKAWFKQLLAQSTEPLIFIVLSFPFRPGATPDRWGTYVTEYQELVAFIAGVPGLASRVVWLSGDMHALAADDGTHSPNGSVQLVAAALDQDGQSSGGLYFNAASWSAGWAPNVTGRGQYGYVTVTDSGDSIGVAYRGYDHTGATLVSLDHTFAAAPGAPAPLNVRVRIGGEWVNAVPRVRKSGAWVEAVMRQRHSGTWS